MKLEQRHIDKAREIWWEIQTSNRNGICIIADGLAAALAEAEDAGRVLDGSTVGGETVRLTWVPMNPPNADDFVARQGDYTAHVEQLDEGIWWCAVYYQDGTIFNSADCDRVCVLRTAHAAKLMCERVIDENEALEERP